MAGKLAGAWETGQRASEGAVERGRRAKRAQRGAGAQASTHVPPFGAGFRGVQCEREAQDEGRGGREEGKHALGQDAGAVALRAGLFVYQAAAIFVEARLLTR